MAKVNRSRWHSIQPVVAVVSKYCAVFIVLVWSIAPFGWLVLSSLSSPGNLLSRPPQIQLTLDNYLVIFGMATLGQDAGRSAAIAADALRVPAAMVYSFLLGLAVVAVNLALGVGAGYAMARFGRFAFMRTMFVVLLVSRMVPALVILLPFFIFFLRLNLLGTFLPLVLTYTAFVLPLVVWIMRSYVTTLPISLERAALVDGCTRLQMLRKVVLPLAVPGMIAAATLAFLLTWNEFLYALVLGGRETMALTIAGFADDIRFGGVAYGVLFASGVLGAIPPVLLALVFQRHLVQGMAAGAAKG